MTPKPPTAQGVTLLLRNAGYECSAETRKGRRVYENTPGFAARRSPAYLDAVLVDWLAGSQADQLFGARVWHPGADRKKEHHDKTKDRDRATRAGHRS